MTYTTKGTKPVPLMAYHLNNTEFVVITINNESVHLDLEQREELAAYLLKETN